MCVRALTLLILLLPGFLHAQYLLRGKVIDKDTRDPLEMAVITDLRTGRNYLSDNNGRFTLKTAGAIHIKVSMIGYTPDTLETRQQTGSVTIALTRGALDLKEVTITNNTGSNGVGSFHTLSRIDLNLQPVRSAQDLLRLVPGLFIAQHQGGGKAEQIFLRGFDADHGTDVNISVDGLPVNMVSQAHGQGYADMHFLIPETIAGYDFGKGVYYADKGDLCTAGYVAYQTLNTLPNSLIKLEGGQYNTGRAVALLNLLPAKAKEKGQSAYLAAEGLYSDGPFDMPQHFNRGNLFGKYITPLGPANILTLTASTLSSKWRASGEIPNRAVAEGYIKDRFGAIDSFQGGNTTRTNALVKLQTRLNDHLNLENQAYYTHYFFNLSSNFTFYYFYPGTGDEFRQHEQRDLYGYNGSLTHKAYFGNSTLVSSAGWGLRYDRIAPSFLAHTLDDDTLLNYIQLGRIRETNVNVFWNETLETGPWLFNIGLRGDYLHFYYANQAPVSDTSAAIYAGRPPSRGKSIVSPKINVQYTVDKNIQVYLKAGKGFHSNDARIVIASQGYQILPAAYGVDLGMNWKPAPRLLLNAALWYLYLEQEFTYGADLGDQEVSPGGRTKREGIDLSGRYQLNDWLYVNGNVNLARPREIGQPKGADYLPLAPTFTSTAGLDFRFHNGWNGGISYRYLHNRPANEDNTLTALGYFITDLSVNYTRPTYELGLAVENLFNQTWNESQFEYTSRLKGETTPVDEVSYTPGTPFFARLKLTIFF